MYKEESTDQLPSVDCRVQVHAELHCSLHTALTTSHINTDNNVQQWNWICRGVCQRQSPGGAGGQGATPEPDSRILWVYF